MEFTEEEKERYSTIERDYDSIKREFKNAKFAYIERDAKIYFLESFDQKLTLNLEKFLEEGKNRLVSVKKEGIKIEEEIKNLSAQVFKTKNEIKNIFIDYKKLNNLKEKNKGKEAKLEKQEKIKKLKLKFSKICKEAKKKVLISENLIEKEKELKNNQTQQKLVILQNKFQELQVKQKRWSRIIYDEMLDDTYTWYKKIRNLIEYFFGEIGKIHKKENGFDMEILQKNKTFTLSIRKGKFVSVSGHEYDDNLVKISNLCLRIESPHFFSLLARKYLYSS